MPILDRYVRNNRQHEYSLIIYHRSGTGSQVSPNTLEKTYHWLITDPSSVERVVEYLELPQEPPAIIESHRPPAYWPSSSENNSLIAVENLVVKYSPELPAVLQDISFTLKAGERIGLLGRTGSGKSTLAMSILRFVDPTEGRILIDGIDTSTIGIHDLRSRLVSPSVPLFLRYSDTLEDIYPARCDPLLWYS